MRTTAIVVPLVLAAFLFPGCASESHAKPVPPPATDLPAPKGGGLQTAVFAGGCFWCVEGAFERIAGVTDVVSGYAGGTKETAEYELVGSGATGHAESVQVTYDPAKISYGQLLRVFFTIHDPTTKDRQGPDWGKQYRSAIFYASPAQKDVAAAYIQKLNEAHVYEAPIVTTLEPLAGFYRAEAYHQDYVRLHPNHPYITTWFPAKRAKLQGQLRDLLKPEARDEK